MRGSIVLALGLIAVLFAACQAPPAADWPQFRGPLQSGRSTATGVPVAWSRESPNLRWRTEIPGLGNSSPIVAGGRIYVTTSYPVDDAQPKGDRWRAVLAIDPEQGEVLWERRLFAAAPERLHQVNTLAAPTPVGDGRHVWVYFGSLLACLDADGRELWRREVEPEYARFSRYGAASSPVLTERAVIVVQDREWADTEDVGWMAAFDRMSGEELWRREWKHTCCSYSTPIVVDRGAGPEIIHAHTGEVAGYAVEDGELLWKHTYSMLQMVSSPALEGDLLAIAGGAHNNRGTIFLRLIGSGSDTQTELMWEDGRLAPEVSTGILLADRLYSVTDRGVLVNRDAQTGKVIWQQRIGQRRNRSALIAAENRLYVASEFGRIVVAAAADSYEELAANELGERGTNATPAIGGGCLLIRTRSALFCFAVAT